MAYGRRAVWPNKHEAEISSVFAPSASAAIMMIFVWKNAILLIFNVVGQSVMMETYSMMCTE